MGDNRYLTVREIARSLRVSRTTVYTWIDSGQLRAIKLGSETSKGTLRINNEEYDRFLKAHETAAISEEAYK